MKIQCPNCKAGYQVVDSKIPDKGAYATCPKCQRRFLVKKEARLQEENKVHSDLKGKKDEKTKTQATSDWWNAAAEGNIDLIKSLLEKNTDVNAKNQDGHTALLFASLNGHIDVVKLLLANGAEVNARSEYDETALLVASFKGHHEVIRLLVENGANVNGKDEKEDTPLLWAAENGEDETGKLLLEHGAEVNTRNQNGHTPLMLAANKGHAAILESLVNHGADVNAKDNEGETALMKAALKGHSKVAQLLLFNDAHVDANSRNGWTSLMNAAGKGHVEVLEILLTNGANVDIMNNQGYSALTYAVFENHVEVVELLLNRGAIDGQGLALSVAERKGSADIVRLLKRGKDRDARTLLAKEHGGRAAISLGDGGVRKKDIPNPAFLFKAAEDGNITSIKALLEEGIDVNLKAENGYTPLLLAEANGHLEVVKLLIAKGADVNTRAKNYVTPLFEAVARSNTEVVELLLSHGADINAKAIGGAAPLHEAAAKGDTKIVEVLLAKGAGVNEKAMNGTTPLHLAALNGHKEVASILLVKGADVNAKEEHGGTPLDFAAIDEYEEVCFLLMAKGGHSADDSAQKYEPAGDAKSSHRKRIVREYITYAAIAIIITFVIRTFIAEAYSIPYPSWMQPAAMEGDCVLVIKVFYNPKRGDIVLFKAKAIVKDVKKQLNQISRIVGLPGEKVRIDEDHKDYINDILLNEPYAKFNQKLPVSETEKDEDVFWVSRQIPLEIELSANNYLVMHDMRGEHKLSGEKN